MKDNMVLSEDNAIELLAFLVTSAQGVVNEPELYGSFRLIDAASRLLGFILGTGRSTNPAVLQRIRDSIEDNKMRMVTDEQGYLAFLDDIVRMTAKELKSAS